MSTVIGIDEVGRGSWAGPLLVVAAMAKRELPEGLRDSKLLSKIRREVLIEEIEASCYLGEGWVQSEEIDQLGLTGAMKLAVSRALIMLSPNSTDEIIMDGNINYCPPEFSNVKTMIKADQSQPIVSAASIYAKVIRDKHMERLAQIYPKYGFDEHVGYGTALHRTMLKVYGPCLIHRRSYKPVAELLEAWMTNHAAGHKAEKIAADYLMKKGYKVLAMNWRNRYCEIDIVVQKRKKVFFVEVKYRQTTSQGTGLDYITLNKLQQMKYAAESWVNDNDWPGDYVLSAIELSGVNFEVTEFIANLD